MSFLLDTNAVSEWSKPQPNAGLMDWMASADEDRIFLSVATIAEIRHGIERLPASRRRNRLDGWLRDDLALRFEGRVLSVEVGIADAWGRIVARREAQGRHIHAMDALLAATAEVHELTLVTRNVSDFESVVKSVLDPWS
jgi:predicted nucleic acid-binding protein